MSKSQSFSYFGSLIVGGVSLGLISCGRSPSARPTAPTPAPPVDQTASIQTFDEPERPSPSTPRPKVTTEIPAEEPSETPAELAAKFRAASEVEDRAEVIDSLWQLDTVHAIETIRQLYLTETSETVKVDMVAGLTDSKKPETRQARFGLIAVAMAPGQPKDVREVAAQMLVDFDDPRAVSLLQQYQNDPDPDVRDAAREGLEARREMEEP